MFKILLSFRVVRLFFISLYKVEFRLVYLPTKFISRLVPAEQCSVRIRLDAPLIDGGEEVLNIRKEKLADATLINLRQAKSLDNVCCAIEDIINDDDDATCDDIQGFKLVSPHFST